MHQVSFPNIFDESKAQIDFDWVKDQLVAKSPFTFIRFSDGEIEILRNRPLEISLEGVKWSKGETKFKYPDYDHKSFVPKRDYKLRDLLLQAAQVTAPRLVKGVPARHNGTSEDRDFMITLNNGTFNLSFADLLINQNFMRFVNELLPVIQKRSDVYVIGNYRMQLQSLSKDWVLIPIGDNVFEKLNPTLDYLNESMRQLSHGSVVLSSASSISNIFGIRLLDLRPDLTFVDIGTALHPLVGMQDSRREYQSQLLDWSPKNWRRKLAYRFFSNSHFLRWD
jgi:hypothetical protein